MTGDSGDDVDVNALFRAVSRQAGRERTLKVDQERVYPSQAHAPVEQTRAATVGSLTLGKDEGVDRYFLTGQLITVGQPIEVYTNQANGWVRGRFEWSGRPSERPTLAIHCWDPDGARDADGLPPWVGELVTLIPERALCRLMD